MLGEVRAQVALLCACVLTLAITPPGAQLLGSATVAVAVVAIAGLVTSRHPAVVLTVRVMPRVPNTRARTPRLCCPVLAPRDPACPRAPGIG